MNDRRLDGRRFLEAARGQGFRRRVEVLEEVLREMVAADARMVCGRVVAPELARETNASLRTVAELLFSGLLEESPARTREVLDDIPASGSPSLIDLEAWKERAPAPEALDVPAGDISVPAVEQFFGVRLPSLLSVEWTRALLAPSSGPFLRGSLADLVSTAQALERWLEQLGELDEADGDIDRPRVLPFAHVVDPESENRDTVVLNLTRGEEVLVTSLEVDAVQRFANVREFLAPPPVSPAMPPKHEAVARPPSLEERCRQALGTERQPALVHECLGIAQSQSGEQVFLALECLLRLGASARIVGALDRESLVQRAGRGFARDIDLVLARLRTVP